MRTIQKKPLILSVAVVCLIIAINFSIRPFESTEPDRPPGNSSVWRSPDINSIAQTSDGELIKYGRELIMRTSYYIGPQGVKGNFSNGMNCGNCHLEGGSKRFGNNYATVAATYPKFRSRSGTIETVSKRINDCLQRSLNGKPLDESSPEMMAMVRYILWVGKDVSRGELVNGAGLKELSLLTTEADSANGLNIYVAYCKQCHGANGEGIRDTTGRNYWQYPPLWGNACRFAQVYHRFVAPCHSKYQSRTGPLQPLEKSASQFHALQGDIGH